MKDNEIAGTGNSIDYVKRMYDPRLARFKSIDPLTAQFPYYTPYQFAGNTPIQAIDLDGAEEFHYIRIRDNKGNTSLQLTGKNNIIDNVLVGYRGGRSLGNDASVPVYEQRTNARQVHTVHDTWREPVDKNGGMNGQDWVDFDVRTFYKSESDAVGGNNGSVSVADMMAMRTTQYAAAVKVDNAGLPALGAGNLRKVATLREVIENPKMLFGKSADDVQEILGDGWKKSSYGKTGTGWQFTDKSGAKVYFNEGGRHGGRYWGIRRGGGVSEQTNLKVVNSEYRQEASDKATHIRVNRK